MSRYVLRLSIFFVVALSLLSRAAEAQIPAFDALYVFGDSLADNGNHLITTKTLRLNPPLPPSASPHNTYFEGRFSNGYVGVEYLWQALSGQAPGSDGGLKPFLAQPLLPLGPAVDFAFGGAGTPFIDQNPAGLFLPGLKGQIELFLSARQPRKQPKRPLFVIITGANDYSSGPYNVPMSIDAVVGNIVDGVKTLYRDGARDVMVLNLPDLGLVPAYGADPFAATQLSLAHNAALKAALDQLGAQLPKLHVIQPDLVEAFQFIPPGMNKTVPALDALFANDPTLPPGFFMSTCLFVAPAACKDIPVPFNIDLNFVFWDILHPTTEAHRFMAQYMLASLTEYYSH